MKSVRTELSWKGGPSNVIGCHTERPPKLLVRAMMTVKNRWLMTKTVWSQVGSYFGHSVAVNDINGDGLDDVIIGAPMHTDFSQVIIIFIILAIILQSLSSFSSQLSNQTDGSYETGRIYVVYQNKEVSEQFQHFNGVSEQFKICELHMWFFSQANEN